MKKPKTIHNIPIIEDLTPPRHGRRRRDPVPEFGETTFLLRAVPNSLWRMVRVAAKSHGVSVRVWLVWLMERELAKSGMWVASSEDVARSEDVASSEEGETHGGKTEESDYCSQPRNY